MHHNISKDICTICRKRNCNKNNSACDKVQRCSRCTSPGHAYPACDQAQYCNFCQNSDHVTNSDKCPHNRDYIKRKLDNIAARRQNNEIANGNENAIGRELLRQGREINQMRNAWQNPPNVNNRNNRHSRSNSRNSRYGRSQSRPRVNPQNRDPRLQANPNTSNQSQFPALQDNPPRQPPQPQTSAPANPPPQTAPQAVAQQPVRQNPEPRIINVSLPEASQLFSTVSKKPICPAAWGMCLMYAAILSKGNNYCLQEFRATVADFCTRNGYHNLHFKNPNRRQIDLMAAGFGNFTPTTVETAQSQPDGTTPTPSGAAIPTQTLPSTPSGATPRSPPLTSSLNGSITASLPNPPTPSSRSNPPSPAETANSSDNPPPSSRDTQDNNASVSAQSSLDSSRSSSKSSTDSGDSLTTSFSETRIRIQPQQVSPNLSPITPESQEDLFKESQACASTPLRSSQDLTLLVSPSQPTVREKVSSFERKPLRPQNRVHTDDSFNIDNNQTHNQSTEDLAKEMFGKGIFLSRTTAGCSRNATLYKAVNGTKINLYTLDKAIKAKEVDFINPRFNSRWKKLIKSALSNTKGELSYPIQWATKSPSWQ